MLRADVVGPVLVRVGALRLVVAADAEVVVREARQVVAEPQRLVERERVVHLAVDEQVVARRLQLQRVGDACRSASAALRFGVSYAFDAEHVDS